MKLYLSSTYIDLKRHRATLGRALRKSGYEVVMMEEYVAREQRVEFACKDDRLHHLEHEEEVMMPLTMKTAATPEARARVVHDQLLGPSESLPDFDWYTGWVVRMLSQHASAAQPPNVATRVFAWGLQHACSPSQWNRLRPIVERNCTPAIWAEMSSKFGLNGDGPIV